MKNPPFNYHRPSSLDEALALLAEHGDDAKVLAGGQSLLPVMALRLGRPEHVDIGTIDGLKHISLHDGKADARTGVTEGENDARGVGEGGMIGAPAALTNAVTDALGVDVLAQYLPPYRLLKLAWRDRGVGTS